MANSFFQHLVNIISEGTIARASQINAIATEIEQGFDKMPSESTLRDNLQNYAVAGGTGDAITLTLGTNVTAYNDGMAVHFKASAANTGPATVNINSIGAIEIVTVEGTSLAADDIPNGGIVSVRYNTTTSKFQLVSDSVVSQRLAAAASAVSAAAALASENAAATSESNAATSESNASTSESNASTYAGNALTSENNAAASYDQFDDRYLGSKASDPTLDNDSNALLTGALYWNSTDDKMRVYNGTVWSDVGSTSSTVYNYTATAGQTAFSGLDDNSVSMTYTSGFLLAFVNGIKLRENEYTATNGTTVTLNVGAEVGDNVSFMTFHVFNVADAYTQAQTDANFAPLTRPRRNYIINGAMDVWQRGTSFTSAATNIFGADRFRYGKSGAMVHDVAKFTNPSTSVFPNNNYMALTTTTADTSIVTGDYTIYSYAVEGYDTADFKQGTAQAKTITLSFWHAHTVTGTYCVAFRNGTNTRSYVAEYTQTTTNTWEKATITLQCDTDTAATWYEDNGKGLTVTWAMAAGSTWHTTADAWQAGNYLSTSSQVNNCGTTSDVGRLAQVKLEIGSTATDFSTAGTNFAEELDKCQRYYEKSNNVGTAPGTSGAVGATAYTVGRASTAIYHGVKFSTKKRATPTVTVYATSTGNADNVWNNDAGPAADAAVSNIIGAGESGFAGLTLTSTPTTTHRHIYQWAAEAEL